MIPSLLRYSRSDNVTSWLPSLTNRARHSVQLGLIVLLLGLGTITVYMTGGTGFAYPYVMLIPVVLAAAWYGLLASLFGAIAAGLLMGPLMPLNVSEGILQPTENWLARLGLYVIIGGFTGWLFHRLYQVTGDHLIALRTDSRTGLPNQSALEDDLQELQQQRKNISVALVFVRILDLSEILEALGTDASDQVVASLAARLKDNCPVKVTLYRFSGSELLMVMELETEHELQQSIEAIRQTGEEVLDVRDIPIRAQISIGSHRSNDSETQPAELIRRARTALFAAVEEAEFYRPYDPVYEQRSNQRVQLISKVRSGLSAREFELFLQPKVLLESGQPQGAEGLIRWHGVDGRLIMPSDFMPKVEDTTLIAPVTRFVVQQACEYMKNDIVDSMSINFAVRNLFDSALIKDLPALFDKAGVDPGRLEIEITEGALIRNPYGARQIIKQLRDQGFKISLDDFGTGYSSLEYLTHLPISGLKIDRAFVKDLQTDPSARAVIKCLIEMAHALSLEITAEGIETERQAEILRDLGVDLGQGFYYSRPVPPDQYHEWHQSRVTQSTQ